MSNYLTSLVDFNIIKEASANPYQGQKFGPYKALGAKRKGAVSERFIKDLFTKMGRKVEDASHTNHDLKINGENVELKTSTLNAPKYNVFSFLQIRPSQSRKVDEANGYDQYMFACVLPNELRVFTMSIDKVYELIDNGTMRPQHGGKNGASGTYTYYATIEDLRRDAVEVIC